MAFTHDTLTQTVQLDHHNAIARNAAEVILLYPSGDPLVNDAAIIQAALDEIGTGRGEILLASGLWNFLTGITINAWFLGLYGAGPHTIINPAPGVDAITINGRTDAYCNYAFGDMAIIGGRSAFHTVDNTEHTANVLTECEWSRLFLFNQSHAAFEFGLPVYRSLFQMVHILGEVPPGDHGFGITSPATRPEYGFDFTSHRSSNQNTIHRCTIRGMNSAALNGQPLGAFASVHGLDVNNCLIEGNLGQVANMDKALDVTFRKTWLEANCQTVQAEPVPLMTFTDSSGIVLEDPYVWPVGAGGQDMSDPVDPDEPYYGGRTTIIRTDNRNGHVVRGQINGYADIGHDGHAVFAHRYAGDVADREPIDYSQRRQLIAAADGSVWEVVPGASFIPVA